ncbi:hypothetical protein NDU88_011291 [Pleurodeles waltl]|uniref:Uncharacterized protein n=1 Tax=Pleurodeles waltl TaxID=8319 RepID=A0AAV7QYS3_PLEWA|nr:hypothetical protein NDU88_011291 [Pleurodeles waltl]
MDDPFVARRASVKVRNATQLLIGNDGAFLSQQEPSLNADRFTMATYDDWSQASRHPQEVAIRAASD